MHISAEQFAGRVLGDYQIQQLLGKGELTAIYLARHITQNQTVTLLTLNLPEEMSAQEREQFTLRFMQEGTNIVKLKHPNILPTYSFGVESDQPYLATAFVNSPSLSQVLKQQQKLTPKQALDVLKQLAAGLDYAHESGMVHGVITPTNILSSNELTVQIGWFGVRKMVEIWKGVQNNRQISSLSTSSIFLGRPEYTSPEQGLGITPNTQSDIYALGIILFELLTGTLPFQGSDPNEIIQKQIKQPVPSIHALVHDVPEALDLVIGKALEQDPAKRYQRAGDLATAYERVLKVLEAKPRSQQLLADTGTTLPPSVNWFDEEALASGKWQLMPPIITKQTPAVTPRSGGEKTQQAQEREKVPASPNPESIAGADPFAWWSPTSAKPEAQPSAFGAMTQQPLVRQIRPNSASRRKPVKQQDRRRVVALLTAGTVATTILAIGGINIIHALQGTQQSQQLGNTQNPGSNSGTTSQGNTPTSGTPSAGQTPGATGTATPGANGTPTPGAKNTPTPGSKPTSTPAPGTTPTPGQQATPTPTQQPPTPTPTPGHTGTVIGSTSMATNSAVSFTNPVDGQASLLVHLSNGSFAAHEKACTHVGVPVVYDAAAGNFHCPAHDAIFNASTGAYISGGPGGLGPLRSVAIRVNADGTITTG